MFVPIFIFGQNSLTNPLICHDKDNYLRCFNDGNYILTFSNGNFKGFRTYDNSITYSDDHKRISFINNKLINDSLSFDTIQIVLLPQSILLKKGSSSIEINSLDKIPKVAGDYGIGSFSIDGVVRGLMFWSDNRQIKLDIWTYGKAWNWNIIVRENAIALALDYNAVKKNRLQHIFILDENLKYGFALSTTFKSLKKISRLHSSYVDTLRIQENGTPVIGEIPLDKYYRYDYDKAGKLKTKTIVGELKLCECN